MLKLVFLVGGVLLLVGFSIYLIFSGQGNLQKNSNKASPNINSFGNKQSFFSNKELIVNLKPTKSSNQSGIVRFYEYNGKLIVTLNFKNSSKNFHPAFIYEGSCQKLGKIKTALVSDKSGKSETILPYSMEALLFDLPLAINVYKSVSEHTTSIACGDIKV